MIRNIGLEIRVAQWTFNAILRLEQQQERPDRR